MPNFLLETFPKVLSIKSWSLSLNFTSWNILSKTLLFRNMSLFLWIQKYPLFYYLVKSGPRYCQITKRQSFLKLTFCIYYWIKQISTQDHSGAIMRTHEHLWALRSTHEESCVWGNGSWLPMIAHGAMSSCSWFLMSLYEGCWCHGTGTMLMSIDGCSWVLMNAHEHPWALRSLAQSTKSTYQH